MSIYAGIPSGAYNSEAAMLYGGLVPDDFNLNAVYNFLLPWFRRNNILTKEAALEIAQAVTDYLKVATSYRLKGDGSGLAEFWRQFMQLPSEQRNTLRRAVNYVRHKKRIPLLTMSRELAQAENWGQALPYLRAVPGIGKRVPRPILRWVTATPLARQLQRSRAQYLFPDMDPMKEEQPDQLDFVAPDQHQIDMFERRQRMAQRMAEQRADLRREFPPVARPKKPVDPAIEALRLRQRQTQQANLLRGLQILNPTAKLEDVF